MLFVFFFFSACCLVCFESSCLISFCFASCFLVVVFFLFLFVWYCVIFGYLSKTSLKKLEIAKKAKMKNAEKRTLGQEQLAHVCSQIVSFFLFYVSLKFAVFAENTIK